jgi:hypothetical protein
MKLGPGLYRHQLNDDPPLPTVRGQPQLVYQLRFRNVRNHSPRAVFF